MSYSNIFLTDFTPVFQGILKAKGMAPEKLELAVIDEEPENYSMFEPADVGDVLQQLSPELNSLTIYTDRPAYFKEFTEIMYEENGLVVMLFSKKELFTQGAWKQKASCGKTMESEENLWKNSRTDSACRLILDFEWEGSCHISRLSRWKNYIPIHKKPWKIAENLDIIVPIGYNTVIVKDIQMAKEKPVRDRFEEAFYKE